MALPIDVGSELTALRKGMDHLAQAVQLLSQRITAVQEMHDWDLSVIQDRIQLIQQATELLILHEQGGTKSPPQPGAISPVSLQGKGGVS